MAKKQFFSIYLLRDSFDSTNAIKEESLDKVGEPVQASNLPDDGILFAFENDPEPPWWIEYWGADVEFEQASKGAIAFIPVNKRVFVFTFGTGFHHLDPSSYEYDFGLRVTLNSVDPDSILSTDAIAPVNAQRQRTQMPTPSGLSDFAFDGDRLVIKRMTGKVTKDFKKPFTQATGAESLRVGLDMQPNQIVKTCKRLLTLYKKKDYEKVFPTIDNLRPEKNPEIVADLRNELCKRLINRSAGVDLTVPDIIHYEKVAGCNFTGVGRSDFYEDINITSYYDYLNSNAVVLKKKGLEQLIKHRVVLVDGNGDDAKTVKQFPLMKCLLCEIEKGDDVYHLSDGEWYRFKKKFVSNIRKTIDKYFEKSIFPQYNHEGEGAYNDDVAVQDPKFICLDRTNMAPKKGGNVEPCDLYCVDGNCAVFAHIKRHTRSALLSHLFNQGANGMELLKLEEESRKRIEGNVRSRIGDNDPNEYVGAISGDQHKVIYGIITHKDTRIKSKNLPIFSCISLRNAIHRLQLMGVDVSCMFIKDKGHKKAVRK